MRATEELGLLSQDTFLLCDLYKIYKYIYITLWTALAAIMNSYTRRILFPRDDVRSAMMAISLEGSIIKDELVRILFPDIAVLQCVPLL